MRANNRPDAVVFTSSSRAHYLAASTLDRAGGTSSSVLTFVQAKGFAVNRYFTKIELPLS